MGIKDFSAKNFSDKLFSVIYTGNSPANMESVLRERKRLWLTDRSGNISCIDLESGKKLWHIQPLEVSFGAILTSIQRDTIYAIADDSVLAIDKNTGEYQVIDGPAISTQRRLLRSDLDGFVCCCTHTEKQGQSPAICVIRFSYTERLWSVVHENASLPIEMENHLLNYDENHKLYGRDGRIILWDFMEDTHKEIAFQQESSELCCYEHLPEGALLFYLNSPVKKEFPLFYLSSDKGTTPLIPLPDTQFVNCPSSMSSVTLPDGDLFTLVASAGHARFFRSFSGGGIPVKLTSSPGFSLNYHSKLYWHGNHLLLIWSAPYGSKNGDVFNVGLVDYRKGTVTRLQQYLATPGGENYKTPRFLFYGDVLVVLCDGRVHILRANDPENFNPESQRSFSFD